jgi:hypothetical protein
VLPVDGQLIHIDWLLIRQIFVEYCDCTRLQTAPGITVEIFDAVQSNFMKMKVAPATKAFCGTLQKVYVNIIEWLACDRDESKLSTGTFEYYNNTTNTFTTTPISSSNSDNNIILMLRGMLPLMKATDSWLDVCNARNKSAPHTPILLDHHQTLQLNTLKALPRLIDKISADVARDEQLSLHKNGFTWQTQNALGCAGFGLASVVDYYSTIHRPNTQINIKNCDSDACERHFSNVKDTTQLITVQSILNSSAKSTACASQNFNDFNNNSLGRGFNRHRNKITSSSNKSNNTSIDLELSATNYNNSDDDDVYTVSRFNRKTRQSVKIEDKKQSKKSRIDKCNEDILIFDSNQFDGEILRTKCKKDISGVN